MNARTLTTVHHVPAQGRRAALTITLTSTTTAEQRLSALRALAGQVAA